MSLRVGVIGCGKIADAHVEQIRATGLAEVIAVCDQELLMAKQIADRLGIKGVYADSKEMIAAEKLDVIHIATPPGSHPAIAHEAMQHGCHVFIEKPFADDLAKAREIFSSANTFNKKVGVNHMFLFESPMIRLQEQFNAGKLGDLVHINTSYGYDLAGDYGTAVLTDEQHWVHRLPGKLFHNVLDHMVCKLAPLLSSGAIEVNCNAARRRKPTGNKIIDALADELRFELRDGQKTVFGFISAHARPVTHTMDVFGTKDSMQLDFNARTSVFTARQTQKGAIGRLFPAATSAKQLLGNFASNLNAFRKYEFHYFQGMRSLLQAYYLSILNDSPVPISQKDILRTCEIMDTIIVAINKCLELQNKDTA